MTPELSRPVAVDRLPPHLLVRADVAECLALAERLHIPEVRSVQCRFTLRRQGATVIAEGVLQADVVQSCVVSLDPVEQRIDDAFTVHFVPETQLPGEDGDEADDTDPEAPDEIPYQGAIIDFGEATAEQLALALDPYPRRPDAELDPAATDAASSPFATLSALRPKE